MSKKIYTLTDIQSGDYPANAKLAVIGNPIAHSLSPLMQQAALNADGQDVQYIPIFCQADKEAFNLLINTLKEKGFIGANVTVPFKQYAFEAAQKTDSLSRLCEASNTLLFRRNVIEAFNTDGPGFNKAITLLMNRKLSTLKIVIVGIGGAGSALAAECALAGCSNLTLANRSIEKVIPFWNKLLSYQPQTTLLRLDSHTLPASIREADVVVNATSLGLHKTDAMPFSPDLLKKGQTFYDVITHATPLYEAARQKGCHAHIGQSMLLWQGVFAYEHWFHHKPDVYLMENILTQALTEDTMEQKTTQPHLTDTELNHMAWNPKQAEAKTERQSDGIYPGDWAQAEALPVLSQSPEITRPLSNEALNMMEWNPMELKIDNISKMERFSSGVKNANRWTDTAFLEMSDWNGANPAAPAAKKVSSMHQSTKSLISHQRQEELSNQK